MKKNSSLRPAGQVEVTGEAPLLAAWDTLQCVHCGGHFPLKAAYADDRGFCAKCGGPVCSRRCAACVPLEAQIENIEAGRDPLTPVPVRLFFGSR